MFFPPGGFDPQSRISHETRKEMSVNPKRNLGYSLGVPPTPCPPLPVSPYFSCLLFGFLLGSQKRLGRFGDNSNCISNCISMPMNLCSRLNLKMFIYYRA